MFDKIPRLALAALLAVMVLALGAGCSKYDSLERNMQYVSNDLLRRDAQLAWETATAAHALWRKAGGGREAGNAAFVAYQDAYLKYAVIYNELLDRQNGSLTGYLRGPTEEAPPAPPGTSAPRQPAPSETPASQADEPKTRELNDAGPAGQPAPLAAGRPAKPASPPVASVAPAGADRYVVASGDTLRLIAKRHGISEKSLMEANGITDPDKIPAGKALTIPAR